MFWNKISLLCELKWITTISLIEKNHIFTWERYHIFYMWRYQFRPFTDRFALFHSWMSQSLLILSKKFFESYSAIFRNFQKKFGNMSTRQNFENLQKSSENVRKSLKKSKNLIISRFRNKHINTWLLGDMKFSLLVVVARGSLLVARETC